MNFKKDDHISHRFYGEGRIVCVRKVWYEIKFDEVGEKNILKEHSTLKPKGYEWTPEEIKRREAFLKRYKIAMETFAGERHFWRTFEENAYGDD